MSNHEIELKKFKEYFARVYPREKDKKFEARLRKTWLRLAEKEWK